jgi:diguanylate cyclase (GGDEF)-like protein
MLVSKLRIKSLDWSIYLLTPLSERQEQANKSFALYIGLGLIVLFLIYKIVYAMVDSYADKLSRKRNYDPLTNLSNRRYAELFFSNRRKLYVPTAVLMIGLDNFKKVRETHGYLAGDLILQKLSDKLSSLVEETDLLVRWNGDKFVVLLMSSEQDEALDFAQKCRELIEQLQINVTNPLIETTASIGVACSRNQNDSLSLMAEWAQQSMQQAKREGKNRVVLKDAS